MRLSTRLAYAVFSPDFAQALRFELRCTLARLRAAISPDQRRRRAELRARRDLRLQLGCGERVFADWVNIDLLSSQADLVLDLRRPLPFADGSARLIYSEHTLEHLTRDEASALLRECARVLAPGGVLRIGVPDAGLYMRAYAAGDEAFFGGLAHLGGTVRALRTPLEIVDQMAHMGGSHRALWDFATLRLVLEEAGLDDVVQFSSGSASRAELQLDDPAHAFETLYVEASRTAR